MRAQDRAVRCDGHHRRVVNARTDTHAGNTDAARTERILLRAAA